MSLDAMVWSRALHQHEPGKSIDSKAIRREIVSRIDRGHLQRIDDLDLLNLGVPSADQSDALPPQDR